MSTAIMYVLPEDMTDAPLVVTKDSNGLVEGLFNKSLGVVKLHSQLTSSDTVKLDAIESFYKGPKYMNDYFTYVPLTLDLNIIAGSVFGYSVPLDIALSMFGLDDIHFSNKTTAYISFTIPSGIHIKGFDLDSNITVDLEYKDDSGEWVSIPLAQGVTNFDPKASDTWRLKCNPKSYGTASVYKFIPIIDETTLPVSSLDIVDIKSCIAITSTGFPTWENTVPAMQISAGKFGDDVVAQFHESTFNYIDKPILVKCDITFKELGNGKI